VVEEFAGDAGRTEVVILKSVAILMHLTNARKCSEISDRRERDRDNGREMRPLQDQDSSSFFRSRERGEIKSDCNHWR